jgi:hypothetical protein
MGSMDEFLRSASHGIVTTSLLIIWSGLLLGIAWKLLARLWSIAQKLLPRRHPALVIVFPPARRHRLTASTFPALVANSPDERQAEAPTRLCLPPHDEFTTESLYFLSFNLTLHNEETRR